ncbi:MAG: hypothetical protein ACI4C1_03910 [Lachnospiraceae bacterium]
MYEANISLNEDDYRNLMYWSLLCKNKLLTILLIIIYGYGMISISMIVRNIYSFNDSMMLTLGISLLCLVMPIITLTMHERRIRQSFKNKNIQEATRKRITMTKTGLTVYRVEKKQLDDYTWEDVEGIYLTKPSIILCMKNKQLLPIYTKNNSADTIAFIQKIAEEKKLYRSAFKGNTIKFILLVITAIGMFLGVPQITE